MKSCLCALALLAGGVTAYANVPDSVSVFLYSTTAGGNHDGLHWAWSADGRKWLAPEGAPSLVSSDYGTWGAGKRMLPPFVIRDNEGVWHALWSVNEEDPTFAHASSTDLIAWKPQDYPVMGRKGENCIDPEASFDPVTGDYLVTWLRIEDGDTTVMGCMTKDFKNYSSGRPVPGNTRLNSRRSFPSFNPDAIGTAHRISRRELDALRNHTDAVLYRNQLAAETYADDSIRFRGLQPVKATLSLSDAAPYAISQMLMGIFFEDISRAADGGLYAELVQNRDFEYHPNDKRWRDAGWNPTRSWSVEGEGLSFTVDSVSPVHANNPHYGVLERTAADGNGTLRNAGFRGIAVKSGEKYDFSMFVRAAGQRKMKLKVSLLTKEGAVVASAVVAARPGDWRKVEATLQPDAAMTDGVLSIEPLQEGTVMVDMVSLFPRDTFKGRKNGLRRDLAETIADLHPRFVRFPGGCVAHGDGLHNIYRWKNTVGPLEARVPQRNIWGYHQTAGLGYHEYFQFCEDLGAAPLPVVAAGVPCQNSSDGGAGQQGGIPMEDMPQYVQDILDLVEYANGDARTTRWGALRAANGHPAPFGLKYLGVGNEDLISDIFKERFTMIFDAVKEKYPDITVIGTVGPFHEGSDYEEGWAFATKSGVPVVDEHYYEAPGWFIYNQDYYDGYDRTRPHVYLGEYASRGNELFNALAEAAYLCGVERNADVVEMTSYAPLLAKEKQTNWNPDLIYFTNTEVHPTVNYHVQKLFGQNSGETYLPADLRLADGYAVNGISRKAVDARVASSVVKGADGSMIIKLVNILPVAADVRLDIAGLAGKTAVRTVLSGAPSSRDAQPETTDITLGEESSVTLPPYSFTLLRIPAE